MKEALSSFDVTAAVVELQRFVGWRIDRVYHPSMEHLVLAVKSAGEGKEFIHFLVGKWLFRSATSTSMPQQPSDFAMMLRKRIINARIKDVRQQGFDRIAVITVEKDDLYELVLELFGDGNVVLVKDGTIVQPLRSHTWKHRDVRARRKFAFPPPVPDPVILNTEELFAILETSDSDVVRTLATKLNLGGTYSEEVCARTGIARSTAAKDVDRPLAESILTEVRRLRNEAESAHRGYVVLIRSQPVDVTPIKMRVHGGKQAMEFESFSEAVEHYAALKPEKKKEKPKEEDKELAKLRRRIVQQEAAVIRLQDDSREAQMTGDSMFAKYGEVSKILELATQRLKDGKGMDDIPGFISFDGKDAILTVKIGVSVFRLDVKGTLESSAKKYYERAKKSRKKLEGLLEVLKEAREEAENSRERGPSEREKKPHKPTKKFWFERYRWFISSEGAVVLGGKDARSNDMLVKKHLEGGDRYAHADVHGAPSVVVKMKEGITKTTLLEACEFAVATSRAWNAKIGSAAGYWVLPEQVSKTPQSGEFIAKGAFVIRGKRNYSDKIEIKLGLGEVRIENERKIMCGPVMALAAKSKKYLVMRPGEIDKNKLSKALSDEFEVPIEEIQSVMPPGDVDVTETVGIVLKKLSS